jgi:hypothetical protein
VKFFIFLKGTLSLKRLGTPELDNEVLSEQPKKGRGSPRKVANALADSQNRRLKLALVDALIEINKFFKIKIKYKWQNVP